MWASEELRNDREIVLAALQNKYKYSGKISDTLLADVVFLKQYIHICETDKTKRARHIVKIINSSDFIFERLLLLIFR